MALTLEQKRERLRDQLDALPVHERLPDLLGKADDPHPRKTRRVEWVGEVSPLDDPIVSWRLMFGLYTPTQETAIRRAAAFARTRGDGFRTRLLEGNDQLAQAIVPGLHRTYIFSKANGYVQDVDYRDYDAIFSSPCAHEFMDPDDPSTDKRPTFFTTAEVERCINAERFNGAIGDIVART